MLSYQHLYHAGNLADVHKHALLAWILAYLTQKEKPLTYIETHAGRGLYDLDADEARKTDEARHGVDRLLPRFAPDHPYRRTVEQVRVQHGLRAYPGSPMIAATLLRDSDTIHLAERHPQEFAALAEAMLPFSARVHAVDGFAKSHELTPPTPRRGMMLVDPSFETEDDYTKMPKFFAQMARKWNVGILALWYPILTSARHHSMLSALKATFPDAFTHEIRFPPIREGHRMIGSGLFAVNPPFGLQDEARRLDKIFGA